MAEPRAPARGPMAGQRERPGAQPHPAGHGAPGLPVLLVLRLFVLADLRRCPLRLGVAGGRRPHGGGAHRRGGAGTAPSAGRSARRHLRRPTRPSPARGAGLDGGGGRAVRVRRPVGRRLDEPGLGHGHCGLRGHGGGRHPAGAERHGVGGDSPRSPAHRSGAAELRHAGVVLHRFPGQRGAHRRVRRGLGLRRVRRPAAAERLVRQPGPAARPSPSTPPTEPSRPRPPPCSRRCGPGCATCSAASPCAAWPSPTWSSA